MKAGVFVLLERELWKRVCRKVVLKAIVEKEENWKEESSKKTKDYKHKLSGLIA